jgi:hypothetical protein
MDHAVALAGVLGWPPGMFVSGTAPRRRTPDGA